MIRVHANPPVLTIDVHGKATMLESPAVEALVESQQARGVRDVRVDLRDCTTLDSTFSGTLLWLSRQLDAKGGKVTLVSPSARVVDLLREMGIDDFYPVERTPRAEGPWVEVEPEHPEAERLRTVVLDAHEELARVPGPAAKTFRDVADELRRNHVRRSRGANG